VLFYAGANVDPKRDVVVAEGPLDHLDHAPERQFIGGKLGIDATAKLPEEGARPWPEEIEMSPEIVALVARRWSEYGIGLVPGAENGGVGKTPSVAPTATTLTPGRGED
jgi:4-hydroxy-3-polyprenylbenzoate decarboxylase